MYIAHSHYLKKCISTINQLLLNTKKYHSSFLYFLFHYLLFYLQNHGSLLISQPANCVLAVLLLLVCSNLIYWLYLSFDSLCCIIIYWIMYELQEIRYRNNLSNIRIPVADGYLRFPPFYSPIRLLLFSFIIFLSFFNLYQYFVLSLPPNLIVNLSHPCSV